jgi:ribosome-associated heat shock protein Hsp15
MRVDAWLDVACLFKTRSEAKRGCESGKVEVNGDHAKPHRAVREGDRVRINRGFASIRMVIRILIDQHVKKSAARALRRRDAQAVAGGAEIRRSERSSAPPGRGHPDRRRRRERRARKGADGYPRNREVIRQWKVLHALGTARHGRHRRAHDDPA